MGGENHPDRLSGGGGRSAAGIFCNNVMDSSTLRPIGSFAVIQLPVDVENEADLDLNQDLLRRPGKEG